MKAEKAEKTTQKACNEQPPKSNQRVSETGTSKSSEEQAPADEESEEQDALEDTNVIGVEAIQNDEEG